MHVSGEDKVLLTSRPTPLGWGHTAHLMKRVWVQVNQLLPQ